MKKNVLLIKGGGGSEHAISLISSDFIKSKINTDQFEIKEVEVDKDFNWNLDGRRCELNFKRQLISDSSNFEIHAAIPCFHGHPGETGAIQSYFELMKIPYLGCNSETSLLCFNKLLTKLCLENLGIKTTPFIQLKNSIDLDEANEFFKTHGECYLKATNQGSSIGCYHIMDVSEISQNIKEAFSYSPFVILEKAISGRELEVSAFEYNGEMRISAPGEIICESDFYDYSEKYSSESSTQTIPVAKNISPEILAEIDSQAKRACEALKIRHLSRIDFFLSDEGEVFINEINTFPGHTKISMFPMMMEESGVSYSNFLNQHLQNLTQ